MSLMSEDMVSRMSPATRVRNGYEALYYNVESGDAEMDDILKREMQMAFRKHKVVLADKPSNEQLRDIVLDSYKSSAAELAGGDTGLTVEQERSIELSFDRFAGNHPNFYKSSFSSFERKFDGMTVDFAEEYERFMNESEPLNHDRLAEDMTAMDDLYVPDASAVRVSGEMSYSQRVPQPQAEALKRSFKQVQQEERSADELKGVAYDSEYDAYARSREGSYQKFTAGDDYGFDEPVADDGLEL